MFIDPNLDNQLGAVEKDGKRIIKLNSLALADHTIRAFNTFKDQVNSGKDGKLLFNVIHARDVEINISQKIKDNFDRVFNKLPLP